MSATDVIAVYRESVVIAVTGEADVDPLVMGGAVEMLAERYALVLAVPSGVVDRARASLRRHGLEVPVFGLRQSPAERKVWRDVSLAAKTLRLPPSEVYSIGGVLPEGLAQFTVRVARSASRRLGSWKGLSRLARGLEVAVLDAGLRRPGEIAALLRFQRGVRRALAGYSPPADLAALVGSDTLFGILVCSSIGAIEQDLLAAFDRSRVPCLLLESALHGLAGGDPVAHRPRFVSAASPSTLAEARAATFVAANRIVALGAPTEGLLEEQGASDTASVAFGERLLTFCRRALEPVARKERKTAILTGRSNLSHAYFADRLAARYSGTPDADPEVPGYWMHGWLPAYHNIHPGLIVVHKLGRQTAAERARLIERDMAEGRHWVGRKDQADFLLAEGYTHARAIGLPFAYLPDVDVRRIPGSLLVMPPHGHGDNLDTFRDLADALRAIMTRFSVVRVCLNESDFVRNDLIDLFESRSIPAFVGVSPAEADSLLRLKRILSSFEFVTTNGLGSHIAYAAACGAKVSMFGPHSALPSSEFMKTSAERNFPGLGQQMEAL
ncbi:hypothetical protein WDZ92_28055, partial [Nostoc sp. NIES-2111]